MKWQDISRKVSSMAIVCLVCAFIAIIISGLWCLFPICHESYMIRGRWIVSAVITFWLLATRRLVVN